MVWGVIGPWWGAVVGGCSGRGFWMVGPWFGVVGLYCPKFSATGTQATRRASTNIVFRPGKYCHDPKSVIQRFFFFFKYRGTTCACSLVSCDVHMAVGFAWHDQPCHAGGSGALACAGWSSTQPLRHGAVSPRSLAPSSADACRVTHRFAWPSCLQLSFPYGFRRHCSWAPLCPLSWTMLPPCVRLSMVAPRRGTFRTCHWPSTLYFAVFGQSLGSST